ncbi:MAG: hypothetical protein H0U23_00670, partial [Blastocatellia bacterium]|nr:hypothetical protein [Blastocatellia bacterium]
MTYQSHAHLYEKLSSATRSILDASRPAYSLRSEVLELKAIFEQAGGLAPDTSRDISSGETLTSGGTAISPTMAAMCVDDFARTVQFIRGPHAAIQAVRTKASDRPVRVLYAGCGPWAPLAIPLMTIFAPRDLHFSLIDIHCDS